MKNEEFEKLEKKFEKIKNFSDILDSIDSLEDKKKLLWKEIYENAVEDREKAKMLFTDCYQAMALSTLADHITAGQIMAKYIERMSKSNDQVLKLAELIASAQKESENVMSDDDIFAKISQGR
jgi:hypothetical protein